MTELIKELGKFGGAGLLFAVIFSTAAAYLLWDMFAAWRKKKKRRKIAPLYGGFLARFEAREKPYLGPMGTAPNNPRQSRRKRSKSRR